MSIFCLQISHIFGANKPCDRESDARKSGTFRVGFRNQSGSVASGPAASSAAGDEDNSRRQVEWLHAQASVGRSVLRR
jgi:hypothetical protein